MQEVDRSVSGDGVALSVLDADALRRWYGNSLTALTRYRRVVNDLNVFPVPDGDTGTNMVTTLTAACAECDLRATTAVPELAAAAARGALFAARGNSGVILAQLLQGLADTWTTEFVDAALLARGLARAARVATEAVAEPAEGTILTVAEAAAAAAVRCVIDGGDERSVAAVVAASEAAEQAVAATIEQLPALTRAGVVDAGGVGFAVVLGELTAVVTGEVPTGVDQLLSRGRSAPVDGVPRESGSQAYEYEVQYLVDADAREVGSLRATLSTLGDSVVIVGSTGDGDTCRTWNVHAHVNDVGAAVEAGITAGRIHRLSVTRFDDTPPTAEPARRAVVVVTETDALNGVFTSENAHNVTGRHLTAVQVVSRLRDTGAAELVVPADTVHRDAAETAAHRLRAEGRRVQVVPIQAPVQAVAALAVRDPRRRFEDDAVAMAEAAGSCRHAEVVRTEAAALTTVGRCEPGDYLALADGDVVLVDADMSVAVRDLVDRLCAAGAELLTLIAGPAFGEPMRRNLAGHLMTTWPLVDVQWLTTEQGEQLLWIGAE